MSASEIIGSGSLLVLSERKFQISTARTQKEKALRHGKDTLYCSAFSFGHPRAGLSGLSCRHTRLKARGSRGEGPKRTMSAPNLGTPAPARGPPPSSGVVPLDLEIAISRSDLGVVFARSDFGEWVDAVPADSDRFSILFSWHPFNTKNKDNFCPQPYRKL